jgi:DNA-binding beta-propeller fold protein YncE
MKKIAVVKNFATIAFLLACLIVLPSARADEANQATKLTFNHSIQISGRVLPAGTYWFVLANINSPDVVQVFNSDRTTLYATILTINAERLNTTNNTAITFAERGFAQPQAIVYWFYPGSTIGHEFLYPKQVQKELAKDKQYTVVAGY